MSTVEFETRLEAPRGDVFARLERPGALTRLWPPFSGRVEREPDRRLEPGSRAAARIAPPGGAGLLAVATTAALPGLPDPLPRWHALHTRLTPGTGFTDVMESGPLRSWEHTHTLSDTTDGTRMLDHVDFELPRGTEPLASRMLPGLRRTFAYRARQLRDDLALAARLPGATPTVAVSGASGLIGRQVTALLAGLGCTVRPLVRREARSSEEISWDPTAHRLDRNALAACDAVVHLAGEPIGGRFTPGRRRAIMDSRVDGTTLLARTLAVLAADGRSRALVCASAIGYYGADGGRVQLDEDAAPGTDFLAQVCVAWEAACRPAVEAGVRVVNVRTGLVLTPQGGLLTRFLPLYLIGLGGPLGRAQWQSWIGIDDLAEIYASAVLDPRLLGPVNAVAPHPVTAAELARTLGRVLHRPAGVPVPRIAPRMLLGAQGARELAEADQYVRPVALTSLGHRFRHPELSAQLEHVLGTDETGMRQLLP